MEGVNTMNDDRLIQPPKGGEDFWGEGTHVRIGIAAFPSWGYVDMLRLEDLLNFSSGCKLHLTLGKNLER